MLSRNVTTTIQSQGLVRQKHGKQWLEAKGIREVSWDKKKKQTKRHLESAKHFFVTSIQPQRRDRRLLMSLDRHITFCQKKQKNETLPPTSNGVQQHNHRVNNQIHIWRCSLDSLQQIPSPVGHGWVIKDGELKPQFMTKDPTSSSLPELTTCACKKSECRSNCSYANVGLSGTETSVCMTEETCYNPHGI